MTDQRTQEQLANRIRSLGDWFQNMNLAGVQTAPRHFLGDYPNCKWELFRHAIPENLNGKSVLEIGCNAGFYSIELKRRGAGRTLGIDSDPRYLAQAKLAAEISEVDVEFRQLDVYDVGSLRERFDIVLFMGVLYHLRHPLLALDLLYQHVVDELLIFQSMLRGSSQVAPVHEDYPFEERRHFEEPHYPKLYFVERRYSGDATNWWIPNKACAEAMLRSSGFEIMDNPESEVYLCRPAQRAEPGAEGPR
jgi:tRNA (mo5U34)-methyltransferase